MFEQPWKLIPNHIRTEGGQEIDRFRGVINPQDTSNGAEAWIGSVTRANGSTKENPDLGCGKVVLPNGLERYLYQVIHEHAAEILGAEHLAAYGEDLGILVKLLDPKHQYLLQAHPTFETAQKLWDADKGKAECWHVLGIRENCDPYIYLGFKPEITAEAFQKAYHSGHLDQIEAMCHRIPVSPGETYVILGGMPHALGEGCFVLEVQEATDFTAVPIRQEELLAYRRRSNPAGVFQPINELLYDSRTVGTFDYRGYTKKALLDITKPFDTYIRTGAWGYEKIIVGISHTPYFECSLISLESTKQIPMIAAHSIQIGIVTQGEGELQSKTGRMKVKRGDELFFPYTCTELSMSGNMKMILCKPGKGTDCI